MLLRDKLSLIQVFRLTWRLDLMIIVVCSLAYVADTYWLKQHVSIPVTVSAVLGTALAFFIGFNNNQAYDRWWEGRKIWGSLVNDSRSWTRNLLHYVDTSVSGEAPHIARRMVFRHLAFIYALNASLRKNGSGYHEGYLSKEEAELVRDTTNVPNSILSIQSADVQQLRSSGAIDGFCFREMNDLVVKNCDSMGKCERISNTVFPPSYLFFTRVFIWFYVILNTLMLAESIGYWSVVFGWAVGFIFHVTHLNGVSIMNPFEKQPMALPLDSICRTIERNLLEMLGHQPLPAALKPLDGQYIL